MKQGNQNKQNQQIKPGQRNEQTGQGGLKQQRGNFQKDVGTNQGNVKK